MARYKSGDSGEVRSSALWGSGNRGGEHRSNALWGKGGRGLLTTVVALAMAVPLAATAAANSGKGSASSAPASGKGSYIAQGLLEKARANPGGKLDVIVRSSVSTDDAEAKVNGLGELRQRLEFVDAVVLEIPAARLDQLAKFDGLTVTEDAPVQLSGYTSTQLWPYESGATRLWDGPQTPTIAIVDSGIDVSRPDFSGRVVASVNFIKKGANSAGDGRGHGTFVAGIAAGSAPNYAGAAPGSKIVSLDVMDDSGAGRTSDVISAVAWIYQNKDRYGIKVANFSLHSGATNYFYLDPLNIAVEQLWFAGVTVVAASGNYGSETGPSGVRHAPATDPFVITVGAADIRGTTKIGDDNRAPWSAYGRTPDGFWKPEICASGRYMIGPIPPASTLAAQKAANITAPGYIELSGTSFAAPVVAGFAAQILARHPEYTPDQVKGVLMHRARPVPNATGSACGVGQVNAIQAATIMRAPNPNRALSPFLVTIQPYGIKLFDGPTWEMISWTDVSWDAVSWDAVSWDAVSWDAVSWSDISWTDVSWDAVSWSDVSWEDQTDEMLDRDGYEATPSEVNAALLDPALQPVG